MKQTRILKEGLTYIPGIDCSTNLASTICRQLNLWAENRDREITIKDLFSEDIARRTKSEIELIELLTPDTMHEWGRYMSTESLIVKINLKKKNLSPTHILATLALLRHHILCSLGGKSKIPFYKGELLKYPPLPL